MQKLLFYLLMLLPVFAVAQSNHAAPPPKFEPINLWFVMLVKGANRSQDSVTAARIQEGHMANITKMHDDGKLIVAGPFVEEDDWRGIFILKCATKEEAERLVKQDPAIVAGRLSYKILPWMTGKNCLFQ